MKEVYYYSCYSLVIMLKHCIYWKMCWHSDTSINGLFFGHNSISNATNEHAIPQILAVRNLLIYRVTGSLTSVYMRRANNDTCAWSNTYGIFSTKYVWLFLLIICFVICLLHIHNQRCLVQYASYSRQFIGSNNRPYNKVEYWFAYVSQHCTYSVIKAHKTDGKI